MDRTEKLHKIWRESQQLSEHLPIKLGESVWDEMVITCRKCGVDVPEKDVHASVSSLIPSVVSVEGAAFCRSYCLIIPVSVRFRADGTTEYVQNGRWLRSLGVDLAQKLAFRVTRRVQRRFANV